ncbi:pentapeptide repeat-containing protein [Nocardia miyunensis]|uniref:pentapeptide repeat-containing protein n=1 Tax=Nocardia miyunensis TaxID=282684 RepID=UPI0008305E8D|nr:pentapeptide repeat-containing protein [Nocardia miyunensis]
MTRVARYLNRVGLFPAIVTALGFGAVLAAGSYWALHGLIATSSAQAAPIDVTKLALTVVAGVGGIVALVVAYRRQRDLEQGRFVERFGAAAAQLGDSDVAVRLAGVYALAGVADESAGLRRQQCIDVLCAYLRLPYTSDVGANDMTKEILKYPASEPAGPEKERHFEYRHNDREVRATIVRMIADHLRFDAEYSWSASDFDLRTANLENADFTAARFGGSARFEGATFYGTALFAEATFAEDARFGRASFRDAAQFGHATFAGKALFEDATFASAAQFENATFSDVARFGGATFSGGAGFVSATFSDVAWFNRATFSGDTRFQHAAFPGEAKFEGTTFSGVVRFRHVTFSGEAWFMHATFADAAWFSAATFSGNARFEHVTFSSTADFGGTTFSGTSWFGDATFGGSAGFVGARFLGEAWFMGATFSGDAGFEGIAFAGETRFERADFGGETVSFAGPQQWGPPKPVFDWDEDHTQKPANVQPQHWPPTTAVAAER